MLICTINTDLHLKQLQKSDVDTLVYLLEHNPEARVEWLKAQPMAAQTQDLRRLVMSYIDTGEMRYFMNGAFDMGIWYQQRIVGVIELHTINPEYRRSDLGYWLDSSIYGQGIMTTAARALLDYSFHTYGLREIRIHCDAGNVKSQAIPERLGFVREFTSTEGIVYVIREQQWTAQPPVGVWQDTSTPD
ncbi:MAG: GNAT family N-acetyltransferase [Anaerolineae bacterium]|nr:GNAT family N-acetyltransferase [Anaerolineae bacterium]